MEPGDTTSRSLGLSRRHMVDAESANLTREATSGLGRCVAAACCLIFAFYAWRLWIVFSDFIYHWGIKAQKFMQAGGVDFDYLARAIRPDYPTLLPELYAVTGMMGGDFQEPAMMLWSLVFLSLAVIGVREGIAAGGASRFALQIGTAVFAAAATAFGIGYRMGGSADWVVAAAISLALPALVRVSGRAADVQIGLAAALASGAKVEGVPLAAFLVAVYLLRRSKERALGGWRGILKTVLAPAIVILPWLWSSLSHGFFVPTNPGIIDAERIVALLRAVQRSLLLPEWHGFDLAALLSTSSPSALPTLTIARRPCGSSAPRLLLRISLRTGRH